MKNETNKSPRASKTPKSASKAKKTAVKAAKTVSKSAKTAKPAVRKVIRKAVAKASPKTRAKSATSSPVAKTAVMAKADIGFGNQMFIRGEGSGLNWDRGILMECRSADEWHWTAGNSDQPFLFKVLINDEVWAEGENHVGRPGETTKVVPVF